MGQISNQLGASPDQQKNEYSEFDGDVSNVHPAIDHVKKSFTEKFNPGMPDAAWVEAIVECAAPSEHSGAIPENPAEGH
jgi:hypothetical protein